MLAFRTNGSLVEATITVDNLTVLGRARRTEKNIIRKGTATFVVENKEDIPAKELNTVTLGEFQQTCRDIHDRMKQGSPPFVDAVIR